MSAFVNAPIPPASRRSPGEGGGRGDGSASGHSGPVRILVTIQKPIFRMGLAALLREHPEFEVVGSAATCLESCRMASEVDPDVLICDLDTDQLCSAECLRTFRSAQPRIPAIVIHDELHDRRVQGAHRLGVQAYVTTNTQPRDLYRAILEVSSGGSFFDHDVDSTLVRLIGEASKGPFSDRERQVLQLLAGGNSNQQIADTLHVSKSTVKYYVSRILRKLKASNRTQAVSMAVDSGVIAAAPENSGESPQTLPDRPAGPGSRPTRAVTRP